CLSGGRHDGGRVRRLRPSSPLGPRSVCIRVMKAPRPSHSRTEWARAQQEGGQAMSWIFRVAVFGGLVFGAAACEGQSPIVGASEAAELSEEGPDLSTSDVGAPCLPTVEWNPDFAGY